MTTRGNINKQNKEGELAVFGKCEDLITYTLNITNNTNKFPKKMRFTITNRIQNKVLDLYECLREANEIYPADREEARERRKLQTRALTLCKELLFFINLSLERGYINDKSCEYWTKLVTNVKYMTAAWLKKDKARFKLK